MEDPAVARSRPSASPGDIYIFVRQKGRADLIVLALFL